jgi:N-acetylglucosamine kinase
MALDGGGSKTRCVLGSLDGEIIADLTTAPSNHQIIGIEKTTEVILSLYEKILDLGKCQPDDISYVVLGLAGADTSHDFSLLNKMASDIFSNVPFEVINDAWLIMRSGTDKFYGAVSIYGTGANAAAINKDGQMKILRALDYHLGGGGGGNEIALTGLHYAFRSNELTYKKTALEEAIPELYQLKNMESLLEIMYPKNQLSHKELNRITPLVFDLAKKDDAVCKEILISKGTTQAHMVTGILMQNQMINTEFPLVLGGSVYTCDNNPFMKTFKNVLLETFPKISFIKPKLAPVAGAYLIGFDRLDISVNQEMKTLIHSSLSLDELK